MLLPPKVGGSPWFRTWFPNPKRTCLKRKTHRDGRLSRQRYLFRLSQKHERHPTPKNLGAWTLHTRKQGEDCLLGRGGWGVGHCPFVVVVVSQKKQIGFRCLLKVWFSHGFVCFQISANPMHGFAQFFNTHILYIDTQANFGSLCKSHARCWRRIRCFLTLFQEV